MAETRAYLAWLEVALADVEGSDTISCNLSGLLPWFTVSNRDDLAQLLKLAPKWNKSAEGNKIAYRAFVDPYDVVIWAQDSAIPPTCHVVKKTRVIPAQEERIEEVEEIVCETNAI